MGCDVGRGMVRGFRRDVRGAMGRNIWSGIGCVRPITKRERLHSGPDAPLVVDGPVVFARLIGVHVSGVRAANVWEVDANGRPTEQVFHVQYFITT